LRQLRLVASAPVGCVSSGWLRQLRLRQLRLRQLCVHFLGVIEALFVLWDLLWLQQALN
jgi:hypothetical protein